MTLVQQMRIRAVHARARAAAKDVRWCCPIHARQTQFALRSLASAFAKATDEAGYLACLTEAISFAETLETLAILTHPAINVKLVGRA